MLCPSSYLNTTSSHGFVRLPSFHIAATGALELYVPSGWGGYDKVGRNFPFFDFVANILDPFHGLMVCMII